MKTKKKYIVIHGHFYQPPRENPWLNRIARQEGAAPYHDYNEKIHDECYGPNAASRILDPFGRVEDIINNYEYLSFNFGATLMRWIEVHHRDTYRKILEADRLSRKRNQGQGNAIAQVYNHVIMPLASRRDQELQVRWGVEDFRARFGRDPQGIWLGETAINSTTVEVLVDQGIAFTILSPDQAKGFRPLAGGPWKDCVSGNIDTMRPYRIRVKRGSRGVRHLDVFFYHKALSVEVSFNHLLRSADKMAAHIAKVVKGSDQEGCLLSIATDGEIYGHHEPFGNMCIAALIDKLAAQGLEYTNFARVLAENPPTFEVALKTGPAGEGTAWSCAHGVGRWTRDCGCPGEGEKKWNQKWRTPLRQGLNALKAELDDLYQTEGRKYLTAPWSALADGLKVLDERATDGGQAFFDSHTEKALDREERIKVRTLMEMQRQAHYMFTSCGWFFEDLAGLEAVQNLRYAARALELARQFTDKELEKPFLAILDKAISNDKASGTGADVYRAAAAAARVGKPILANHYLIGALLEADLPLPGHRVVLNNKLEYRRQKTHTLCLDLSLIEAFTTRRWRFLCIGTMTGLEDLKTMVKGDDDGSAFLEAAARFRNQEDFPLWSNYGESLMGLGQLLPRELESVMAQVLATGKEPIFKAGENLVGELLHLVELLGHRAIPLTAEMRLGLRYLITEYMAKEILSAIDAGRYRRIELALKYRELARRIGVELDQKVIVERILDELKRLLDKLARRLSLSCCQRISDLLNTAEQFDVPVATDENTETLFNILVRLASGTEVAIGAEVSHLLFHIAERMNIRIKAFKGNIVKPPVT